MSKEQFFWNWFKENNSKYYYLNQIVDADKKELLLEDFLNHLHDYCHSLFFEIGGLPNESQELIITAAGNVEYFDKVEELVSKAPQINDWLIIAFKPPMGCDFVTKYEDVEVDPAKIWFLPLDNNANPDLLGLKIQINDFDSKKRETFLEAIYIVIDTILGEKSAALDIDFIKVDKLPDKPEEKGLINLCELPAYIGWRKSKK